MLSCLFEFHWNFISVWFVDVCGGMDVCGDVDVHGDVQGDVEAHGCVGGVYVSGGCGCEWGVCMSVFIYSLWH